MYVIIVVLVCILFDIVSGLLKGVYTGTLNSTYLRKGLLHKATEILVIVGSALLEYGIQYIELGVDIPMLKVVGGYIALMEIVSVLENVAEVNPKLNKLLKPFLEKLHQEEK